VGVYYAMKRQAFRDLLADYGVRFIVVLLDFVLWLVSEGVSVRTASHPRIDSAARAKQALSDWRD